MQDNASFTSGRDPGRGRRLRVVGLVGAALMAIGLLATACSSGSSPGVASTGSASAKPSSGQSPSALAFATCMRAHGITNFPDPNGSGQLVIKSQSGSGTGGVNPGSPQFQSASQACQHLMPGAGNSGSQAQLQTNALNFSKCMRAHGITNFPDPNAQGGFKVSGIDLNSPQVQSAQKACQRYMQAPGLGGSSAP